MRHWKKVLPAAVLLAALAVGLAIPAFGSTANVNLMAVNERVLETTPENMPRTVGGVLYVPYTMLSALDSGINLGVNAMYSTTKRTVVVTDGQRGVMFNTQSNTAQDMEGNPVSVRAMVRNGTIFVPIDYLCEFFGTIRCTRTATRYGTVVRVTNGAAILSDQDLVDAATASGQLADNLNRYLAAGGRGEGDDPVPSGGAASSEEPSGAELYLACRWGAEAEECARLAEERELRVLFLFTPAQLREQDDLVRRLAGAGHTVGLILEGDSLAECLDQGEEGRLLLAAIARCPGLVVSASGLDEEGREALAREGYAVWAPTARGEDYASGAALVRGLDSGQVNYVELDCGQGAASFRGVLNAMEEGNCRIYQATAPALA